MNIKGISGFLLLLVTLVATMVLDPFAMLDNSCIVCDNDVVNVVNGVCLFLCVCILKTRNFCTFGLPWEDN